MNEKDIKALVVPLATITTLVVLSVIGNIAESRRLKKEGRDLHMRNEALKINRQTRKWMTSDAILKLEPAVFGKQLNERIDFARFIQNH